MEQRTFFEPSSTGLTDVDMAHWPLHPSWEGLRSEFLASAAGLSLRKFLSVRLASGAKIYPPQPFNALQLTALEEVRVLILGQDPYHGPGQAHGLAFSVQSGQRPPPSLRNIFKEIARDDAEALQSAECDAAYGPQSPSLTPWAKQGVLLLNTCLTVEEGQPASHAGQGWERLTDAVMESVDTQTQPVVFMLWGAHAQAKQSLINARRHLVLTANHPSPLSALRPPQPFLGCGHFSQANAWLLKKGQKVIHW